ncbi:two-component system, NarL family, sensor histidine kinase ComP [Anaerolineae bacterium]|nr:two-component system, NarL family, sensor histidine kinase ComP [Anaerolineae bacterium]
MLKRWRSASLRTRLPVQFSIVFGIIVIVFVYTSIQALNSSTQEALKERAIVAQLMADHVDAQLNQAKLTLQSALTSEKINLEDNNLEPEKELLKNLYDHTILFKYVYLLDSSDNLLWQVPSNDPASVVNPTSQSLIKLPNGSKQSPFSAIVDARSGSAAVAITLPIVDSKEQLVGFLRGWVDLADPRASSLLYPYEPGKYGYSDLIDLIDQKGAVLLSTREDRIGQITDHASHLSALVQNKQATVGSCHACHNAQGDSRQKEILAFAPLKNVSWGIALHQPEDEVFANTRALTYQFGVVGLVLLIMFLVVARFTTRGIVTPLQELTRVARQIAAGDLSQPVPITNIAEIISLRNSFEEMRLNLVQDRERLLGYQRDLEHRVEERTAELTQYRDYLLKTNRNLTELNAVATLLARSLDLTKTLNAATERVRNDMSADACGILLSDDQELLTLAAHHGLPANVLPSIQRITHSELFPNESKTPISINDPAWHCACREALKKRLTWKSLLCTPLQAEGKMLGSLFVANRRENHFTPEDETLLNTMGWQIAMTVINARLFETVKNKEKERAKMLDQIISAQEEERGRIARELHDETSQAVSALILGLDTAETAREINPAEAVAIQQSNKTIARQMLENLRRIIADLRPALLDDMGLVPAVARHARKRLNPLGIVLRFDVDDVQGQRLPPDLEIVLFRVVQEAINNIIRHARASKVTIKLAIHSNCTTLRIEDDGQGFDPRAAQSSDSQDNGFGLRGIQERVSIIGGEFELQTAPGQGTVVTVRVPLER